MRSQFLKHSRLRYSRLYRWSSLLVFGLCLGWSQVTLATEPPPPTFVPSQVWTKTAWDYSDNDYVVILVESASPTLQVESVLQATTSVWAAYPSHLPSDPLVFHLVTDRVSTFRWSAKKLEQDDLVPPRAPGPVAWPSPRITAPPSDFYGEDAHVPPGIYFLSYTRKQIEELEGFGTTIRHRLGLSDDKCSPYTSHCSVEIRAPGVVKSRFGVQFHAFRADLAPEGCRLKAGASSGCLTTTQANFSKIFSESFIDPATSPVSWNRTHQHVDHNGRGNVLVFVTDALSPGWRMQADTFRHWLTNGRLRGAEFSGGAETSTLRAEWRRLARAEPAGIEDVARAYQKEVQEISRALSGSQTDLSERLFFAMTDGFSRSGSADQTEVPLEAPKLVAANFPKIIGLGSNQRDAFEKRVWERTIEGLAHEDLSREEVASLIATEVPELSAGTRDEIIAAIALYRLAGRAEPLSTDPRVALKGLAEYQQAIEHLQTSGAELESKAAQRAATAMAALSDFSDAIGAYEQDYLRRFEAFERQRRTTDQVQLSDVAKLAGVRDEAAALVRGAEILEKRVRTGAPTEQELDYVVGLLPDGEVKDAAEKFATAYTSFQAFNQPETDYERVGIALNGVIEILDLEDDPTASTVMTALDVGLSLASGNYVGAVMSILGATGGAGSGERKPWL